MAENDAPKADWNRDYCTTRFYEGDNRKALKIGDVLKVVEVTPDVLDLHYGKCESYRLTPIADLAAPDAAQLAWNKAVAAAPHTEEAGEVCTPDCQGCNDPVAALIADRNEARAIAFTRGRRVEALEVAGNRLLAELATAIKAGYRPNLLDLTKAKQLLAEPESDAVRQARRETWEAAIGCVKNLWDNDEGQRI